MKRAPRLLSPLLPAPVCAPAGLAQGGGGEGADAPVMHPSPHGRK